MQYNIHIIKKVDIRAEACISPTEHVSQRDVVGACRDIYARCCCFFIS